VKTFGDVPTARNGHVCVAGAREQLYVQGGFDGARLDDFYILNLGTSTRNARARR
jgi:hypothetical protein